METFSSRHNFRISRYVGNRRYLDIYAGRYSLRKTLNLIFDGVFYMELPFDFDGLELVEPTASDLDHLTARCGTPPADGQYYVLVSQGKRYYVGASHLTIENNNFTYAEPSSRTQQVKEKEEM